MTYELIMARVRAFGVQLLGLFVTAAIGFLAQFLGSDAVHSLIVDNFGDTLAAAALFMAVQHIVAHLQNLQTVKLFGGASRYDLRRMLV